MRAHGKGTPKQNQESVPTTTLDRQFDTGYRSGATRSTLVRRLSRYRFHGLRKTGDVGTAGELRRAVLDYYQEHAYLSYGGVDRGRNRGCVWKCPSMQDAVEAPECFYVPGPGSRARPFLSARTGDAGIWISRVIPILSILGDEAKALETFVSSASWSGKP